MIMISHKINSKEPSIKVKHYHHLYRMATLRNKSKKTFFTKGYRFTNNSFYLFFHFTIHYKTGIIIVTKTIFVYIPEMTCETN